MASLALARQAASFNDFKEAIAKVCILIGCPIPEEAKIILWELFAKKFSGLNMGEFILAFEMNLNREFSFDIFNGKEWEQIDRKQHYQNFSGEFMTDVLRAYEAHKFTIIGELKEKEKSQMQTLPASTESKNQQAHQNILNQILGDFTADKPLIFSIKYDVLKEDGLLILTKEQRDDYKQQAKEMLRIKAIRDNDFKFIKELNNGGQRDYVLSEAKKLAYMDYLKNKANAGILSDHIKTPSINLLNSSSVILV